MAVKKPPSGAGGPQPHPLVDRLTGAPDVSVLFGYPARDPQSGFWRIYQDLGFQSYLRVAEDDIVSTQTLATEEEPLRPSVVWVRRGADVEQTRVEARRLQAGFLQGPLVEGLGGFPFARTRPPRTLDARSGDLQHRHLPIPRLRWLFHPHPGVRERVRRLRGRGRRQLGSLLSDQGIRLRRNRGVHGRAGVRPIAPQR